MRDTLRDRLVSRVETDVSRETSVQNARVARGDVLGALEAHEHVLALAGWPAISSWWWEQLRALYTSSARQIVLRVGRRGGKSSTLCRVAVAEALAGDHAIPPGDLGVVAIVSVSRPEAAQRLYTIRALLDALGVAYHPVDGGVALDGRPIAFRVHTASMQGVVGMTAICCICDEVARWRDADTGANPATQVLASLRPAMATMPHARMFLSSSPVGLVDAHAEAFARGATAMQRVAHAATWTANPSLTEAATRAMAADEDEWRREYAAIPIEGTESSLISPASIDACTRAEQSVSREPGVSYVAAMDPAMRGNGWTLVVLGRRWVVRAGAPRIVRSVVAHREWRGTSAAPLDPYSTLECVRDTIAAYGLAHVWSDQRDFDSLRAIGARLGLTLQQDTASAASNLEMYSALRNALDAGEVELPPDAQVRADLLGVLRATTANGLAIRLADTSDGRHCDYAASVALALRHPLPEPASVDARGAVEMAHVAEFERKREQDADFRSALERYGARRTSGHGLRTGRGF